MMIVPRFLSRCTRCFNDLVIVGRSMLAMIRSKDRFGSLVPSPSRGVTRRLTLFLAMLSTAFSIATGSLSIAKAEAAPSLTAEIARIPFPHPKSSTLSPGRKYS